MLHLVRMRGFKEHACGQQLMQFGCRLPGSTLYEARKHVDKMWKQVGPRAGMFCCVLCLSAASRHFAC
jgi:hypothetical protein